MNYTKTEEEKTETTVEAIEEDWSGIVKSGSSDNLYNNDDDGRSSFSYYDALVFPLGGAVSVKLRCMKRLTPLDMLDLSNGVRDSTGNRVWMGAIFFLECFVRPIGKTAAAASTNANANTNTKKMNNNNDSSRAALRRLRRALFHDKTVLELGTGTGVSLIAVGMAGRVNGTVDQQQPENETETLVRSRKLTLTDNDATVLSLCRMNCKANFDTNGNGNDEDKDERNPCYTVGRLDWEEFCKQQEPPQHQQQLVTSAGVTPDPFFLEPSSLVSSHDCVVATDVVYHLSTIEILFRTACKVLKQGGTFVLAHVPRADIDCRPCLIRESLESEILAAATSHGFSSSSSVVGVDNNTAEKNTRGAEEEDSLCSALKILCTDNNDINNNGDSNNIIRPSSIMGIWADERENDKDEDRPKSSWNTKSFFSSEYDYDDLEATGASILIFVKK